MNCSTPKLSAKNNLFSSEKEQTLNEQLQTLKRDIKRLNENKGKLSREIGQRKKFGRPFDHILNEMKVISKELKQIKVKQSEIQPALTKLNTDTGDQDSKKQLIPAHFCKAPPSSSKPEKITVKLAQGTQWQKQWNDFVDQQAHACIYHRYEFKQVIEQSFGHSALYLVAMDSHNDLQGILAAVHTNSHLFGNYITSLPFFNYGGPLATSPQVEESLIQALANEAETRGAKHIEIRENHTRENYPVRTNKVSMFLPLPNDPELLWKNIGSKLRAQINKGQSHNLVFTTGGEELLDDFYKIFSVNMRDLGTPVYAKSLFRNLLQQKTLDSTLAILYHHKQPVSCAFLLGFNDTMEIPWASTLRSANPLNANMVLYKKVLDFAIHSGYQFFDFGRSSKDAGTYKFKKQWGAQPAPLYWHYWLKDGGDLPQLNPNNPKYQFVIKVWQHLPVFVCNFIGPYVVRNLP